MSGARAGTVVCPHCDAEVASGSWCGHCGSHLAAAPGRLRRRTYAYAVAPHEHVLHVAVVSSLFPHLPHRHARSFRGVLVASAAAVLLLVALRLDTTATIAAAVTLPAVYLLYLNEVDAYRGEPVLVLGATVVAGALFGTLFARLLSPALADLYVTGDRLTLVLIGGVMAPIVGQALMVAGPLPLLLRRDFEEGLDGLVFGVAASLGFSMAAMLVAQWPIIVGRLVGDAPSTDWALQLVREGLLVFTVNAATTGAITATLWLARHRRVRGLRHPLLRSPLLAVVAALLLQVGLGIATVLLDDLALLVVVWAAGAAVAIVGLRVVIHHGLLMEGAPAPPGPPSVCVRCHHLVPTMRFCPVCGAARAASPAGHRRGGTAAPAAP